ncbi:MAG TPA: hypothetical protein DEA22_13175, partial [Blastocatellia bacterium]|nr:hypothetical protein [Blastocatellia bacterium]
MSETHEVFGVRSGVDSPKISGIGAASGNGANAGGVRPFLTDAAVADPFDRTHSENGYNFTGIDSLGLPVKGFVQTSEIAQARNELERAGVRILSISERRGARQINRRPTGIEFATLAEQFGDLMEIGESPTQVCRLLAYAQTNKVLMDALLNAGELVMNGWTLSEAFAAQRDPKGEQLFPITFICALRIGEEIGTATDDDSGLNKSA